ncbi:hypothetical protein TREMEDRAFT_44662 [Tremella mesenterica DSM 1558]|uniref:uncharacterized protein n=1 Tax=Tremella mesenterica (strain ATCC 24925 / CBS 8224 / DSM 1558 / NBRC 9311 / NRRL Y-6157 / RJB 2259-6 / UBC 559-6) TaxID=578456 RepID=UPI0003F4A0EB|nr:uncharacterized protein TREMEDRAFT_44662 [Tremella mesenterica DSM 1558]EIW68239.1 hypothetical protein TREMEDRAFT_44662 [Tremella mesenterica DSM 1558]
MGESESSKAQHLGRYRDDPLSEMLNAPGIMVTAVQNKERSAEREFIDYLEQVVDELYPETVEVDVKDDPEEEEDLEKMLKKELEGMSGKGKQMSTRFRLCRHEVACVFYVVCLPPLEPLKIILHILEKMEKTAKCPFKFVKRTIPIQAASGATLVQLKESSKSIIARGFEPVLSEDKSLRFGIIVSARHWDKLQKLDMIKNLAENVEELGMGHKVDLNNQDRTILIEAYKNSLGVSVVREYERYKKVSFDVSCWPFLLLPFAHH